MKKSRTKILLSVAVVTLIGGYLALTYLQRPQPSFKEAVTFVRSVDAFVEARAQRGQQRPPSVQLRDLVDGGFVTQSTARRFDGSEIAVLQTPNEGRPQDMLVRLRLRDGRLIALLADGSVQQLPP
jgi:hypothetical protein